MYTLSGLKSELITEDDMSQSIVLSPANKNTGLLILSHNLVLSVLVEQLSFQISNTFCLLFVRNTIKVYFSRIL